MKFILQLRNDLVTDYTAYPNHPGSPYNLVSVISFIFLFLFFKRKEELLLRGNLEISAEWNDQLWKTPE